MRARAVPPPAACVLRKPGRLREGARARAPMRLRAGRPELPRRRAATRRPSGPSRARARTPPGTGRDPGRARRSARPRGRAGRRGRRRRPARRGGHVARDRGQGESRNVPIERGEPCRALHESEGSSAPEALGSRLSRAAPRRCAGRRRARKPRPPQPRRRPDPALRRWRRSPLRPRPLAPRRNGCPARRGKRGAPRPSSAATIDAAWASRSPVWAGSRSASASASATAPPASPSPAPRLAAKRASSCAMSIGVAPAASSRAELRAARSSSPDSSAEARASARSARSPGPNSTSRFTSTSSSRIATGNVCVSSPGVRQAPERRSNRQPCHGQVIVSPTTSPCSSGYPSCGHARATANTSPVPARTTTASRPPCADRQEASRSVQLGEGADSHRAGHQSGTSATSSPATTCSASDRRWWPSTSSSNE